MNYVIDTSAAVDIILKKGNYSIFVDALDSADVVITPELFVSEIANVAWKYYRLADFSFEQCMQLSQDGINLIDQFIPSKELWKEALQDAIRNNHPVYDCLYLVCARRNGAILLTKDKKLQQICDKADIPLI
ncbi:MAG: type II toxin-antitoxin system VapC family toxin [Spirochaetia bacterium]